MSLDDERAEIAECNYYLASAGAEVDNFVKEESTQTADLESQGWREWLMTLMPFAFEEEFSADHVRFWDLYWSVLLRLRRQKELFKAGLVPKEEVEQDAFFKQHDCFIEFHEFAILLILGRGLAKSSTIEAAAVMRGCFLGGYCLYVCHAKGTQIFDPDRPFAGWHAVEDHPGLMGIRRCDGFEVFLAGLPNVTSSEVVTPEHRYFARRIATRQVKGIGQDTRHGTPGWVEAEQLDWNTWIGYPIDQTVNSDFPLLKQWNNTEKTFEDVQFEHFNNPDFWWLVGLWWGDGTLGGARGSQIGISCGDSRPEVRERLFTVLHSLGYNPQETRPKTGAKNSNVTFCDSVLTRWLQTWKFGNSRKKPPLWVEQMPFQLQNHLIKGYIDADGSYDKRGVRIASVYLDGLLSVRRILSRLGVACTIGAGGRAVRRMVIDGRKVTAGRLFNLRMSDVDIPDGPVRRNELRQVFIAEGFIWSRVQDIKRVTDREFVPITTASKTYHTAFGLSHNCEAQDQAEEHIGNCKGLLSDEDGRTVEFYPHMRIDDNAVFKGKRTKNRTDLFITAGGWICRAKGLNASLRGIRVGNLRPDNILIDDIDSVNDSIAVSIKKLKELTSKVIPTQARRYATILVGQNLIGETTVVNMIYTGQTDALAERTEIGVSNTFERFRLGHEYTTSLDESDGRIKHKILPTAIPTWAGVRISDAQKFLNDSGLETFLAEYMNSFEHLKSEKVFEFDEKRHLITWNAFEKMFGVRHVPGNWRAKMSGDIGYSKESLSCWLWVARSAQNAKLPGRYFGYRARTFEMDSIDDQAIAMWEDLFPDPSTGKRHFEATQRFIDYPDLFNNLKTRPRCARYMSSFEYNPIKDKFELKSVDFKTWDNVPEEDKALYYVRKANQTFQSQIQSVVISHEKTGEQKTLAQKYGIPATKVKRFEADAGVAEANHLLRGDYTVPHPFYADEIVEETGLYKLGSPYIFFVVDRIEAPRGDQDFKTFREHVGGQRWTQEKLGELGLSKTIPMKYKSDAADSFRMFACDYALPESTPKTMAEEILDRIPEQYQRKPGVGVTVEEEMSARAAREYAEELAKIELGWEDPDDEEDYDY